MTDTPIVQPIVIAASKPPAPGWRTSEFWSMAVTSVVSTVVAICNAAFGWHIDPATILSVVGPVALMVSSYAISRGQAKKAV